MRLSPKQVYAKKKKNEKITVLTAYDFPMARILDEAGVDILLVGDSLGMVVLGYENTLPVTMIDMMHHTEAVSRAVKRALVVADLPYGAYESPKRAVSNSKLLVEEAGADAVKLEGGKKVEKSVRAILDAGIPVMGHIGMTPQSVKEFGGYKVQGRDKNRAEEIHADALLLDRLGVFAIVIECVPLSLGQALSREVQCPTIGIGAGPHTSGQVLVLHDMLGFESSVHPRFVRRYASIEKEISGAAKKYISDVKTGKFPSPEESYT